MNETASLREAYGRELLAAAREDQRIVALDCDLSGSTKTCYLAEEFPERYFEMGIAEQNMVSTAAGLALVGKIPFVNSFAVFATGRPYDQIRQGVCIPRLDVKIAGSSCGLSDFGDGATHQSVEDVAIMRSIPNMTVIAPVDAHEVRRAVRAAIAQPGPVYMRINRNDLPVVTEKEAPFTIGDIYTLREGGDITVFASGIMVSRALQAAEILGNEGIELRVINVPTLKPLDEKTVQLQASDVRGVITAEEHSLIGGLGDAVRTALSRSPVPVESVGIRDRFGQSAESYDQLLSEYGLTADAVVEAAHSLS